MIPRPATPDDPAMLARIHVQAWQETYADLLPPEEIAARDFKYRNALWTKIIARGHSRLWVIDDLGFAQVGPQRESVYRDAFPEELYAMYLIRPAYGTGAAQALLQKAVGSDGKPFNTCVLAENGRACSFYEKSGGTLIDTRHEVIGKSPIVERVYGWQTPSTVMMD